jgi:hypothetical protein
LELNRRELNALRRLLNKAEFGPQDVARIGVAHLESAPGLGEKGLAHVLAWLEAEGYCLQSSSFGNSRDTGRQDRINRRLEQAQHLLEQWGWQVKRPEGGDANQD